MDAAVGNAGANVGTPQEEEVIGVTARMSGSPRRSYVPGIHGPPRSRSNDQNVQTLERGVPESEGIPTACSFQQAAVHSNTAAELSKVVGTPADRGTGASLQSGVILGTAPQQQNSPAHTATHDTYVGGPGKQLSKYPACNEILTGLFPSLSRLDEAHAAMGGPTLRKKRQITGASSIVPPAFITPRLTTDPLAANKPIWILHPQYGERAVAQGKSGISWKSKTKMGTMCATGEQWIFVHRILIVDVPVLHGSASDGPQTLECALPPTTGKHHCIKWSSRYCVQFKI